MSEWDLEEDYFGDQRKENKRQKKIASRTDRSKYKKTDLNKQLPKPLIDKEGLLYGRVLSIISQDITVECEGQLYTCTLRGTLKQERTRIKNLITVGDKVYFEKGNGFTGSIHEVEERKSFLSRADHQLKRSEQLIAANIDLVLITSSAALPDLKPALIDRYIIAAQIGQMEPVIVINKIDLLKDKRHAKEKVIFEHMVETYRHLGFKVLPVSCVTDEGFDALKAVMKDKTSCFSGQSGTGKSSLINKVTGLDLAVGPITKKTLKGGHTTTTAKLITLSFGGWCIDTPGIRSFGVWSLRKDEVRHHFQEFEALSPHCKYPNCTHITEPGCAVLEALEEGKISPFRYDSYVKLFFEEDWEIL